MEYGSPPMVVATKDSGVGINKTVRGYTTMQEAQPILAISRTFSNTAEVRKISQTGINTLVSTSRANLTVTDGTNGQMETYTRASSGKEAGQVKAN
jgi:hypothetical protein